MNLLIKYDKQPVEFLKKSEKQISSRIIEKISSLKNNPVPSNVKSIVGEHGVFRIRIGDYRALYRINYQDKILVVFKIDKRANIYD